MDETKLNARFTNPEKIEMFLMSVVFLCKQAQEVVLCFTGDTVVLLVQKPLIYVELNMKDMTDDYEFQGLDGTTESQATQQFIYIVVKSNRLGSGFKTLNKSNTQSILILLKHRNDDQHTLAVNASINEEGIINTINMEIPVILLPNDKWMRFDIHEKSKFDATCEMKLNQMKRYVDNYKHFPLLRLILCHSTLTFQSITEDSSMRTAFVLQRQDRNIIEEMNEVQVVTKKLLGYLQSISSIGFHGVHLVCSIQNQKMMRMSFEIPFKNAIINFFLEHIDDGIEDDSLSEEEEERY